MTCNGCGIVVNLDLRSNGFSGVPSEIGEPRNLESLVLSDNRMNILIPQEREIGSFKDVEYFKQRIRRECPNSNNQSP